MSSQLIRILFHITAWAVFLLSPFLFFLPFNILVQTGPLVFLELIFIDVLLISFYYFNYSIAIPRYFFHRKYLAYFSLLLGWLMGIIIIRLNMDLYPAPPTAKGGFMGTSGVIIFRFTILAVISFGEKTYDRWKQTEAAKLRAELQGNTTGTFRWNHLLNDKVFSNTSLIYSQYSYQTANNPRRKYSIHYFKDPGLPYQTGFRILSC